MQRTTPTANDRPNVVAAGGPTSLAIGTLRTLSINAAAKAKSGHIGTPMGLAPVG